MGLSILVSVQVKRVGLRPGAMETKRDKVSDESIHGSSDDDSQEIPRARILLPSPIRRHFGYLGMV